MKKKSICILGAVLCLSLTACGGTGTAQTESDSTANAKSSKTDNKTDSNEVMITADELLSYREEVTLTPDNWEDYFTIGDFSYVANDSSYDAKPGETVNSKTLNFKEGEHLVADQDLNLKFTYTLTCTAASYFNQETGEDVESDAAQYSVGKTSDEDSMISGRVLNIGAATLYSDKTVSYGYESDGVSEGLQKTWDIENVQDFKLSIVEGTLYQVNIPDDKWNTDKEHGRYIVVEYSDDSDRNYYMFESGATGYGSVDDINWDSENLGTNGCASWAWERFDLETEDDVEIDPDSITYEKYDAETIQADMYSDVNAAAEKYAGQYVEITGILETAEVNDNSTPPGKVVYLKTTAETTEENAGILFAAYSWDDEYLSLEDFEDAIADMQEGDTVVLRGYIDSSAISADGSIRTMGMDLISVEKK